MDVVRKHNQSFSCASFGSSPGADAARGRRVEPSGCSAGAL